MSLFATFQTFTQREKVLLAGLGLVVLITGFVYVFPLFFTDKTTSSQVSMPPMVPVKQAVMTEIHAKYDLPVANIKNPFQVPPQYQVRKETAPAGNTPAGQGQIPVSIVPALSGIIVSGSTKMAIIELGGNSDAVGIGGTMGGYTVASITDTQVVLDGPEGRQVLNIGR